jgi:hypothetical protein
MFPHAPLRASHFVMTSKLAELRDRRLHEALRGPRPVSIKLDVGLSGAASVMIATHGARPTFESFAVPAAGLPAADAAIVSSQVGFWSPSMLSVAAVDCVHVRLCADLRIDLTKIRA